MRSLGSRLQHLQIGNAVGETRLHFIAHAKSLGTGDGVPLRVSDQCVAALKDEFRVQQLQAKRRAVETLLMTLQHRTKAGGQPGLQDLLSMPKPGGP